MSDEELRQRVQTLRTQGHSPKQIARMLGVRPARVAPLVRAVAQDRAAADPDAVLDCWVNAGWSAGLAVPEEHGWPDRPPPGSDTLGVVGVLVAQHGQRDRGNRVSVCGYLVDAYCLGVKDALGPRTMSRSQLHRFVDYFFEPFDGAPVRAPVDLARHLVWGAVEYARGLGFDPHPDFAPAAGHLEPLDGPSAIGFGRYGKPFYMQGPYDDPDRVMATLDAHVGKGNYEFVVEVPLDEFEFVPTR